MSRKLGDIFTFHPTLPPGKKIRPKFIARPVKGAWKSTFLIVITVLLAAALCCGVWYMRGKERAKNAEKALLSKAADNKTKCAEKGKAPAPVPSTNTAPNAQAAAPQKAPAAAAPTKK
jgi:hypothetical protein